MALHGERQVDRRGLPVSPAALGRTTLAEVLVRFRDEVVPTTKSAEVDTSIINVFLRRPLAKVALSALTPGKFAQYRDERLQQVCADTAIPEWSSGTRIFGRRCFWRSWASSGQAGQLRRSGSL